MKITIKMKKSANKTSHKKAKPIKRIVIKAKKPKTKRYKLKKWQTLA